MSEVLATPEARRLAAAAEIKKREDGIRAKGVQEGRTAERRDILAKVGAKTLEDLSMLERTKQDMREAFEREEKKHVKAGYWRGFAIGGMVAGAIVGTGAALYAAAVIRPAFEAAGQFRMQDQVVNQMDRQVNPPAPDYRQQP